MDFKGFPVDASILSADAFTREVLPEYALDLPRHCKFLQKGLNDTYAVGAGDVRYYLRVYRHGWRSEAEIDAEVDLLNRLHSDGQPVSIPVPKKNGTYTTKIDAPEGIRYAVLFTEAQGKRPTFDTSNCQRFGAIVANLHASMDRQPTDTRRFDLDLTHLIDEPLTHIEAMLSQRPKEVGYLRSAANELKDRIDSLLTKTGPEYGVCHGDHQGGNVHEDSDGRLVVFDFDCFGRGWRAYDLAVFRWQATGLAGLNYTGNKGALSQWDAFLEGYFRVRSLTAAELAATHIFVPIRRIWWMGMHTRLAQTIGPSPVPNLAGLDRDAQTTWFDQHIGLIRRNINQL